MPTEIRCLTGYRSLGAAALLGIALAWPCLGQRALSPASTPAVRELTAAAAVRFPAPAPMMIVNEIQCDSQGDVFAIYADAGTVLSHGGDPSRLPVRELIPGAGSVVTFPVPIIPGYLDVVRSAFSVDAQGRFYALLQAYPARSSGTGEADSFVAEYDSAGSVSSRVELRGVQGEQIVPTRFAVLGNGDFVVSGSANANGERKAFAAIFSSNGDYESTLPVPPSAQAMPYPTPHQPAAAMRKKIAAAREATSSFALPFPLVLSYSRMASAPNGDVYLLWGTIPPHLDVISPDGQIARQFDVPIPAAGMKALQLAPISGDRVFIQFTPYPTTFGSKGSAGKKPIDVLDTKTGEVLATYELGRSAGLAVGAGIGPSGHFLFLGSSSDKKSLAVLKFSAPPAN